jgi:hypothetical protein
MLYYQICFLLRTYIWKHLLEFRSQKFVTDPDLDPSLEQIAKRERTAGWYFKKGQAT